MDRLTKQLSACLHKVELSELAPYGRQRLEGDLVIAVVLMNNNVFSTLSVHMGFRVVNGHNERLRGAQINLCRSGRVVERLTIDEGLQMGFYLPREEDLDEYTLVLVKSSLGPVPTHETEEVVG